MGSEVKAAIKILLTDDNGDARAAIRRFLDSEPGFSVVGEADGGEEALRMTRELGPDVVLMDLEMPGMSGIEATRRLHAAIPKLRVIGLSIHTEPAYRREMERAGATAFVAKEQAFEELPAAIRDAVGERL